MSERVPPTSTGDAPANGMNGFGPSRRSAVRFALSVGVAIVAVLAIHLYQPGWFTASALPAPGPTAQPGPTATPAPPPRPKPSDPYVGGSHVSADNIKVTLLDIQYTSGGGGRVPNKGNTFAIVRLRVENLQGKDYPFLPNVNCQLQVGCNFYVQDDQGEKNPPIPYDPFNTALRAVVLQPGGQQDGSYTFEVPARDKDSDRLKLLWYPQPLIAPDTLYHWILESDPHHHAR